MNRNLSISQRIHALEAAQEVQNTLGRHTWLHARNFSREEFSVNWSKRDDISWTQDWGRVQTRESFWYAKVTGYDMMPYRMYVKNYPVWPEIGGLDPRPLFGAAIHATNSDIIEVADDGLSARGTWLAPGVIHSPLHPDKRPLRLTDLERYGADFVYEEGRWLFLHNQVCPDIMIPGDHINWAAEEYAQARSGCGAEKAEEGAIPTELPYPVDDKGPFHIPYSISQTPQDSVPWPEPYRTLDEKNSYYWAKPGDALRSCVPAWVEKHMDCAG